MLIDFYESGDFFILVIKLERRLNFILYRNVIHEENDLMTFIFAVLALQAVI